MSLTGKPSLTTAQAIANDGFWPDLQIGELMSQYRIPPEYADDVIKTGLVLAMVRVNEQLEAVQTEIIAGGHTTLAAYIAAKPVNQVNGKDVLTLHYQTAVFARAKAGLIPQFNQLNRKANAENAAKESDDSVDYWLNESQSSIKSLFAVVLPEENVSGQAGTYVGLI